MIDLVETRPTIAIVERGFQKVESLSNWLSMELTKVSSIIQHMVRKTGLL